jgi:hypothetical protein
MQYNRLKKYSAEEERIRGYNFDTGGRKVLLVNNYLENGNEVVYTFYLNNEQSVVLKLPFRSYFLKFFALHKVNETTFDTYYDGSGYDKKVYDGGNLSVWTSISISDIAYLSQTETSEIEYVKLYFASPITGWVKVAITYSV